MASWWVNHNQTFEQEVTGGYIWSPRENRNGARNQTYLNLTRVKPGDRVFSYASQQIQAIGVVAGVYHEQARPIEFGAVGEAWSRTGWMVPIGWQRLPVPFSPKSFIEQIRPLLPRTNSPINPDGRGNQVCYLAAISSELAKLLLSIASQQTDVAMSALMDGGALLSES